MHHLKKPDGVIDRVIHDRYIIYHVKGAEDFPKRYFKVYDGHMGNDICVTYSNWEHFNCHREGIHTNYVESIEIGESLANFHHNMMLCALTDLFNEGSNDCAGMLFISDYQIGQYRSLFTKDEMERANRPNRSFQWLPMRIKKRVCEDMRKSLVCRVCGTHEGFTSVFMKTIHEADCYMMGIRERIIRERMGLM